MTTTVDKLEELARRCEEATGDDVLELINLECDICRALGIETSTHETPFTSSLDAAMTLVPEGYSVGLEAVVCCGGEAVCIQADVWSGQRPDDAMAEVWTTPALALCAAALKARSRSQGALGE